MRRLRTRLNLVLALAGLLVASPFLPGETQATGIAVAASEAASSQALPLAFEPVGGTSNSPHYFQAHSPTGTFLFSATSITLQTALCGSATGPTRQQSSCTAGMFFEGANTSAGVVPGDRLPGVVSYLKGNDPSRWQTGLPTYASITYNGLYPGVSLTYSGQEGELQATLAIQPHTRPETVRLGYSDLDRISKDPGGSLLWTGRGSTLLKQESPTAWQQVGGQTVGVSAGYTISRGNRASLQVGGYDPAYPIYLSFRLTAGSAREIQGKQAKRGTRSLAAAQLAYSTYLGGQYDEAGTGIAVDAAGNAYLTGMTSSPNFPVANAAQPAFAGGRFDAMVVKLDPTGSRILYSTYLGGTGDDEGWAIAVDRNGSAYITGKNDSSDFPTRNALQPTYGGAIDSYLAKLSPDGTSLVYSTYLGGAGTDEAWGIAVDPLGTAIVTGETSSTNFPTANALQPALHGTSDIFVSRFSPNGTSFVYSTYLGGGARDAGEAVATDRDGNAYLTGTTSSTDFPTANALQPTYGGGDQDIYVTKLDGTGRHLLYSTYLGGTGNDQGWAIAVSRTGNAYLTGYTSSTNYPVVNAVQPTNGGGTDAFATAIDSSGSRLIYSSYLGGNGDYDGGYGVAVDLEGNAYYTGLTSSANFPVANAIQPASAGSDEFFITKIGPLGSTLPYSTFLGGAGSDYGYGMAVDASGNAYIAGQTRSTNFPVANAIQPASAGDLDVAVVKVSVPCTAAFTDIGSGNPLYPFVHDLACLGIVGGYADGSFRPNASVTRAQLAKIIAASANRVDPPGAQEYEDVPPGNQFFDVVQRLTIHGAISGYPCGQSPDEPCVPPANRPYFRPNATATRGQVARIVALAAGLSEPSGAQVFEDVPPDNTFYAQVQALAAQGTISGYPCGGDGEPCVPPANRPYYRPDRTVSRAQASKLAVGTFFVGYTP